MLLRFMRYCKRRKPHLLTPSSPKRASRHLLVWDRLRQISYTHANKILTSFTFQLYTESIFSTWNAFSDVNKYLFQDFVSFIQLETWKLKLLPLGMCHKYHCLQQGAPYLSQLAVRLKTAVLQLIKNDCIK